MKNACVAVLCALFLLAPNAQAADDGEGWRPIFDGKTLKGWKGSEGPGHWSVENGVIVGRGTRSHLYYMAETFKDFEFTAEVKTQPKTNSGIYFHTRYLETGWPDKGHESQVNVSHGDSVRTGSIYNVVKLYETPAKDGEWYTHYIRVKDRNIVVKVNDKVVLDYTEPEGVKGGRKVSQGLFAFQQHDPGSVVRYRNVMVRGEPVAVAAAAAGVHGFTVKDIDGKDRCLSECRGKVVLMVNVASKCGYTKQYAGLQKLYDDLKGKGLVVVGVPSNDFRNQEPGTEAQIKQFCSSKYNVTFPMLAKVCVKNGEKQCPLYQYLSTKSKNGRLEAKVSWNFNKFLIGKDGLPIKHYESKVKPDDAGLRADILAAIGQ